MSRAFFAAGALLASASLVQAGDHASFSPDLKDPAATSAPALPAPVAAEAAPAPRGRSSRRRTRLARARAAKALALAARKSAPADSAAPLTIGGIPAPLPPSHDGSDASDAVAMLSVPRDPSGRTERAAPAPQADEASGGQVEAPSNTLAKLLAKHAMANGVPLKLAQAVVRIESRGNPRAANHGALGLMQIKYETARAAGFAGPAVRLFVADINLQYGMKVLGQAYKAAGGDTCGALMRYQSGHLARRMSAANRAYCSRARALMAGG
jgi:soluble lytic murein transglycosylase-like protein